MWWNIVKNTKQSSRQLVNLDWDEEAISIEDEDCLKWLVEYHNIILKYEDLVTHRIQGPTINKISNELACLIKQKFQQGGPDGDIDYKGDITGSISFELTPSKVGTGWFDIFISIVKDRFGPVEYLMNSGLTRTWARCEPEMEIGIIKGNTKEILAFVGRFVGGRNLWMRRMCKFLKELINHVNNPNLEDYCIDALSKQWYYWFTKLEINGSPVMLEKDLEQLKEIIETEYWI
tara:strand:+ start:1722 stop:2420 length:699 start_codon:yes stop_codon:yes gene_type:complete